jgi:Na+/H+ antiporter NhaA
MSVHHWINHGFMALFFFVIGLELKREILVGELADPIQALLPIVAAIGGMVMPALIYIVFNPQGHTLDGWGVPMATDIAFALGALALLGNRVPKSLLTFLIALAIVDDLGAVLVIALFYTETLDFVALGVVAVLLALLSSLNLGGIRRPLPYLLLGALLWLAMLKSGVHATVAGIFLAFAIPMRPKYDPERLFTQARQMLEDIRQVYSKDKNILAGLVVGKLAGVAGFAWLAVKLGFGRLPEDLNFKHIVGVGLMSGIGFTMSIFIAELGFANHQEDLLMAKTGVLFGSAIAGLSGYAWLLLTNRRSR